MRGKAAAAALFAAAFLVAPSPLAAQSARTAAEPAARLVRGAEPVLGLPGFGANAFPAIYGEYRLAAAPDAPAVRVWASREALYFAPGAWKSGRAGDYRAYRRAAGPDERELPAGGSFRLVALDRPLPTGGQGGRPEDWSLVAAFPAETAADTEAGFMAALTGRFAYFALSAKSPADVSLPAYLEF
jgi:hypothetical protein